MNILTDINTLSGILFLSYDDAKKLDRTKYIPRFSIWHQSVTNINFSQSDSPRNRICAVCLAGAVIAGTLEGTWEEDLDPESFENAEIENRLAALEDLRVGKVTKALRSMNIDIEENYQRAFGLTRNIRYANFTNWEEFDLFLEEMRTFAADLEAAGL